jgi:L1 cell adhesion molecule like protein
MRAVRRLRTACERAKRTLSSVTSTTIEVDSLMDGEDFSLKVSRAKFEELCADLFQNCLAPNEIYQTILINIAGYGHC